jgi:hypothetical protein
MVQLVKLILNIQGFGDPSYDPVASKGMSKFQRFVWHGVPDEWDLRRQVWPWLMIGQAPKLEPKLERHRLDQRILEHIAIELEHEDCFRILGAAAEGVDRTGGEISCSFTSFFKQTIILYMWISAISCINVRSM